MRLRGGWIGYFGAEGCGIKAVKVMAGAKQNLTIDLCH
jgi:hypothetical protein